MSDLLLTNGHFFGTGAWAHGVDSAAVSGGVIVGLGTRADVEGLVPKGTESVDLQGQWVLPGFIDAHVHPVQAGMELNTCDLAGADDKDGYLATIAAYATGNPDAAWILGGGWSLPAFAGALPTASMLDGISPSRPAFLPNRDHHSAWVNSAALRVAGITARTPDPHDGRIERGADGEPTGTLHEGAMELVRTHIPPATADELLQALLTAQTHLQSLGITGWQDALVGTGLGMPDTLDVYRSAIRTGALTAKVVGAQWWDRARGEEQIEELLGRRTRAADSGFRAGSVKIMQDGVCETFTAAVIDPYLDQHGNATGNHGLSFIEAADLATYVQLLDAQDFQVHIHALGDRAVRDSLDAIEHATAVNGQRGNRHHLAHIQIVQPQDVPRFAALDVTANAQPLWACNDAQMAEMTMPFLGDAARRQQYVFRSVLDSGAGLAFGSDWPVTSADPLQGIHVAVNRTSPDGEGGALLPEQRLTVVEAIDAYTRGSAFVNRLEDEAGTIAVGYAADFAVIDADLLAIEPESESIADTSVVRTYVDGRLVFER